MEKVPTRVAQGVQEVDQIGADLEVLKEPQDSTEAWVI